MFRSFSVGLSILVGFLVVAVAGHAGEARFRFAGPEIFPIDHQIYGLQQADFDGDGRNDLVMVDNLRSKLRFLYNRSAEEIATDRKRPAKVASKLNDLPPDARFGLEDLLMDTRIGGLVIADFNGDGLPDLAAQGESRKLQLFLNDGRRRWRDPLATEVEASQAGMNTIAKGDLNGDGRIDVVLLADGFVEVLYQATKGGFERALKIPFSGQPNAVHVVDVDADSREDLLLISWDDDRPLRVRFQNEDHVLGPETQFDYPKFRAFEVGDLNGDGNLEWLTIAQTSGRAHLTRFKAVAGGAPSAKSPLRLLPLRRTSAARRGVLWADLNGDGLTDLVYSESDQGSLRVLTQSKSGRLGEGRSFPSLTGVAEIFREDWDGDGLAELFVFSPEEKQVGVIRPGKSGRLPFPELFSFRGKPLAMAVGRFRVDEPVTVAVLVDDSGEYGLFLARAGEAGRQISLPKDFRSNPAKLFFHDADQDGELDLICLTPYEKINVLTRKGEDTFEARDVFPPGGAVAQPVYGLADLDGDGKAELLLPQKNFVRAVVLDTHSGLGNATFRVKEQINGESGDSRIAAILSVPGSKTGKQRLQLLDAGRNRWTEVERNKDGVWSIAREIELPRNDFDAMQAISLKEVTVAFAGPNTVGWLDEGDAGLRVDRDAGYDTVIENGRLMDVEFGDLNGDGRADVLFIEGARNHLEIATISKDGTLRNAAWWQVFEQRTFRNVGGGLPEPREAVIGDFTGDGKNDIAILVHDRVLLYPQD